MSNVRARDDDRARLEHELWERVMHRLRVCSRVLGALLAALVARMVISGAAVATVLTATIIAVLLLVSVLLSRHGRRLEPRAPRARRPIDTAGDPAVRRRRGR